jgi:membrane-associated protease RseP (regulator of RpoE activity)
MTLTDERTSFGTEAHSTGDDHHRRPGLRAVLLTVGAIGLLVVLVALVVGGGSSRSNRSTVSSTTAPSTGAAATNGTAQTAGGDGSAASAAGGGGSTAAGPVFGTAGSAADSGTPLVATAPAPKTPAAPVDTVTKVVKTGEIDLQVGKHQVPHTIDKLIALAKLENGFVADSHSSEGDNPSGSVTLRVPVQSFEATISEVRTHVAGKVLEQQTAGEDVTSKYVDLSARVHSLQATRATYERLLAHADTIGDILAVQSRISDLQTQIEQLQGELRVLNDQTTYGTLTVTVSEGGTVKTAVVHHQSGMSKAFHRSLNRFVHGIEAIVGIIGPLLLVALLAGLGYLVFRAVYRRLSPSAAGAGRSGPVGDDRLVGEQ